MIYCDTSLLVAALTNEACSDAVRAWLGDRADDRLALSAWTAVEFSSAVAIKARTGQIDPAGRERLLAAWRGLVVGRFEEIAIVAADFARAGQFVDRDEGGLRGGDALHLAIASRVDAALASLDRRQRAGAASCHIAVVEDLP